MVISLSPSVANDTRTYRFSSPAPFHKFIPRDRKIERYPFTNRLPRFAIN